MDVQPGSLEAASDAFSNVPSFSSACGIWIEMPRSQKGAGQGWWEKLAVTGGCVDGDV